jgi:hypothetical protein
MSESGPMTSRIRLQVLAIPALLAGLAISACSDNSSSGGGTTGLPASTSYVGLYASNTGTTGPLTITFTTAVKAPPVSHNDIVGASAAPNNATGTVGVNGTDVPISGSLDGSALHMTGAGGLDLAGTLSNGVIKGTWTDTGGDAGNFTAASNTDGTPAAAYCGGFNGVMAADQSPETGTFSAVIACTEVHGVIVGSGGTAEDFEGTAVPGTTAGTGTFKIKQTVGQGTLTVNDGTYDNSTTQGHYTTSAGTTTVSNGTFSGNKGCPVL